MKFVVIYIIFCCNFIYIVECKCKNCYAFIKIAKIEYLLIKEAFSYSQIFIAWLTHDFCLWVAWGHAIYSVFVAWGHATYWVWGCVGSLICHDYCHLWTFIPPISTILHHVIYYNLSFKSILQMIYALMDEYYLFSFISNKLIIMHYFTNDSSNKLVVTLFTIFSLQSNFQIEDLIFKSANSEIRWFKEWQFCG